MTAPHGRAVTEAAQGEAAQSLTRMGDANLADKGLSIGDGTHGSNVGKQDAVYATYRTKSTDTTNVEVAHTLGRIPKVVNLASQEVTAQAAGNSTLTVALVRRNEWTASTFRISVYNVTGSVGDVILTFILG